MKTEKFLRFAGSLVVALLLLGMTVGSVFAAAPNNKYGIHLAQPHFEDLKAAAQLVNSAGGDWGYVTLVIQENDRHLTKWQEIFDRLRELHLIPIIRLATVPEGPSWRRPSQDSTDDWVKFLDSLNWVVKNRYVVLFNEPNHGSEWGGEVDAENYAQVAFQFTKKLKEKNPDFFVMLAGLDASAPSAPPNFEDEKIFVRDVINHVSTIFDHTDGWVSHSYPNPGFSGSPWDSGRGTVRGYQWELALLQRLGVNKKLPVFITETGWRRGNENTMAEYYKTAFEQVWLPDERVVAVTPFVLDYQSEPFLQFSWKLPSASDVRSSNTRNFYQQYYTVQSLAKIKGEPKQEEVGEIIFDLPGQLVVHSSYQLKIKLKNLGQAIWDKNNDYNLSVAIADNRLIEYLFSDIKNIKPFEEEEISFFLKTKKETKKQNLKIVLQKKEKNIFASKDWSLTILPLPTLLAKVQLFPKLVTTASNFEIQIFDERENPVFKKSGLKIKGGEGEVGDIQNIILGKKYRLVILKPYYLPRQEFIVFQKENNKIRFKAMLPFDFNKNGRLDGGDLSSLLRQPSLLRLFFL